MEKISTPVIFTGLTAARTRSRVPVAAIVPRNPRRDRLRILPVLLDRVLIEVQAKPRKLRQQNEPILNPEHIRCAYQLLRGLPLLLRQVRTTDDLLPLTIGHGTSCLDVSCQRQRRRPMLNAGNTKGF